MNLIHPNRVQVLGQIELNHLRDLDTVDRTSALENPLCQEKLPLFIIANNHVIPDEFRSKADTNRVPMLVSPLPSHELVRLLRFELARLFADKVTLHGVFMEVISVGVLLTGESAVGKSELALELITRGHRLIADDAPEFFSYHSRKYSMGTVLPCYVTF